MPEILPPGVPGLTDDELSVQWLRSHEAQHFYALGARRSYLAGLEAALGAMPEPANVESESYYYRVHRAIRQLKGKA